MKPSKDANVLTDINTYEDTWTPPQKDEPFMAVIDADVLFGLSAAEKDIVTTYFKNTRKLKVEKLKRELLGISGFKGKYKTLHKLTKKGMFRHDTKEHEVLLAPNIICPRQPTRRIDDDIIKSSKVTVHKYTGAITNGEYYIHYDVLNLMQSYTPKQLKVLRYLLTIMDSTNNTVTLHISKTAKELKIRVHDVREILGVLHDSNKLIFISESKVTSILPSQTYTVMLSPEWFIKSLSNYIAFRHSFKFFLRVINDGYPVNKGVFNNYISDSVIAVSTVKATFNKNNKIMKTRRADAVKALQRGENINIEFIETDFINIKENYINENY